MNEYATGYLYIPSYSKDSFPQNFEVKYNQQYEFLHMNLCSTPLEDRSWGCINKWNVPHMSNCSTIVRVPQINKSWRWRHDDERANLQNISLQLIAPTDVSFRTYDVFFILSGNVAAEMNQLGIYQLHRFIAAGN